MRRGHSLLAAVIVTIAGAAVAVPAAPAHALPYCLGTWTNYARCSFEAPARAFLMTGTAEAPEDSEGIAEASVRVFVEIGGIQYTVDSCAARGPSPQTCARRVDTPFDGMVHYCEVFGYRTGTYACFDPPRLPLPI